MTWNIRAGGGKRIPGILEVIREESPDVLVLTEFRPIPGKLLLAGLEDIGFHILAGEPDGPHNSVCILSKFPIDAGHAPATPKFLHRWIPVSIPELDLTILGVHVPNVSEVWNKREFLQCIDDFTHAHLSRQAIVIGDLNTARDEDCQGAFINEATYFNGYLAKGWVDAWRSLHAEAREYTWYSHKKNGFRLDHCLVSPSLAPKIKRAWYRHDVLESKLSDHSVMVVEFDLSPR